MNFAENRSEKEVSDLISQAYARDRGRPGLVALKQFTRVGRKYGFPVVCTLADKPELEQLRWAARLLLEVGGTWPREDIPEELLLIPGSTLYEDATMLISIGLGNAENIIPGPKREWKKPGEIF